MIINFNDNWLFKEEALNSDNNYKDEKIQILKPEFFFENSKNLSYSEVSIPHDWMISKTKDLYRNSVGYYKKQFLISQEQIQSRHLSIQFEGVYMNCGIWINNQFAKEWKHGYTTFEVDISPFVKNGINEILVICVYQNCNTRWYSGAGIYRDVSFIDKPKTYLPLAGNYIVSKRIDKNTSKWSLKIFTEISGNTDSHTISSTFTDLKGNIFLQTEKTLQTTTELEIQNPLIWDIEHPDYYIVTTNLYDKNNTLIDSITMNYGFKTTRFDKNEGFFLNDRHVVIHGACHHHDHGVLGSAFNKNALKRQFLKLKEMGINAIRCSHNPPPKAWMDLTDELGLLVDDECFDMWQIAKTPFDYSNFFDKWYAKDVESWVKKDRNHPSLLMWSIGNEIADTKFESGLEITKKLYSEVRKHDPEKVAPITSASNYMMTEGAQKCADELDLVGYNYLEYLYDEHHKKNPDWIIYESETSSTVQSRGIYHFPENLNLITFSDGQCSTLGNCTTPWGGKNTQFVITETKHKKFCFGQFIWTGWDYIGEPTPYHTKNSYFGQIDTAGFEKDTFFLYKAEWNKNAEPFVHILPYWDWNEGQQIDIKAYTNANYVELFKNGISLGLQKIDHENSVNPFGIWHTRYQKGEIKAVAYDLNKKIIAEEIKKSFEDPAFIKMTAETYDTENLFFVDLMLLDKNNVPVENARNYITVMVNGEAKLLGMDNGDSTDYDEYLSADEKKHSRRLFSNRLVAVIQAKNKNSKFEVYAASKDLQTAGLYYDGIKWSQIDSNSLISNLQIKPEINYVPARKIEITNNKNTNLDKNLSETKVYASVLPLNATNKEISWQSVLKECIPSDSIQITNTMSDSNNKQSAIIKAKNDGECILRCTCKNNTNLDEVISDLNFCIQGFKKAPKNPYKLIEGCRLDDWDKSKNKPKICLEGGIDLVHGDNFWFSYSNINFGEKGSDKIHIPIYTYLSELSLEIWDGKPEENKSLGKFTYKHESIYNVYSENIFTLNKNLTGIHTISFSFSNGNYFKGFYFDKK